MSHACYQLLPCFLGNYSVNASTLVMKQFVADRDQCQCSLPLVELVSEFLQQKVTCDKKSCMNFLKYFLIVSHKHLIQVQHLVYSVSRSLKSGYVNKKKTQMYRVELRRYKLYSFYGSYHFNVVKSTCVKRNKNVKKSAQSQVFFHSTT